MSIGRRRVGPVLLALALLAAAFTGVTPAAAAHASGELDVSNVGTVRITEWMYQGPGGEFVELTNVGDQPVDMTGWSYDDDSATPGVFSLSGFGVVRPGESVVFTEAGVEAFRTEWTLCEGVKLLGGYTNNIGRADQINVFDASNQLVDRLTYGDQTFPGSIRTNGASGWVTAAGLGADNPLLWTLSTVGDTEGSHLSVGEAIGSPGTSTFGGYDACRDGEIRITEWMYAGAGGEFVELTNVGNSAIDLAGWSYDDDSRLPGVFDLGGFGVVEAGESVVFAEVDPSVFRTDWDLCEATKVIGPYTNNIGRNDEINIFDADDELADRLTYGDEAFPGSIRTTGASGWVSVAGLGANDPLAWTLATVGDFEASKQSTAGAIGSPGISTFGGYNPCGGGGDPTGGEIRISEWMYDGAGGEFVELTNAGDEPVDMTGWSYDDDSRLPGVFPLSGFGTLLPGETAVFAEVEPAAFRTSWELCDAAKVIGPYTNNLGRNDEINIFDADGEVADRLTYGDEAFPGSIRTTGASGWVSVAGIGANDPLMWTLATVDDAERSWQSTGGAIGSPGVSSFGRPNPCGDGEIRITEWMYQGPDGEFVELSNVGGDPIDLTGWSYDDDSRLPGSFSLAGFGVVLPGESVVFTEGSPAAFRSSWDLCESAKVIGPYANNIGRNDEINIFDADDELADRLTYGDQTFPGSIRTTGASGWVSVAGLGANDPLAWTLATVGDAERSWQSTGGAIGSPGVSTHGGFDPCDGGDPTTSPVVTLGDTIVVGSIGDPTNPGTTLTLTDPDHDVADLTLTVTVVNPAVVAPAGITVMGDGADRTVAFAPAGRGVTAVTFTATDPDGNTGTANLSYGASNQAPDPSGRYHHHISDASAALGVGDGHVILLNDETNTIFLHREGVSGPPVKTWSFTSVQLGTGSEIDFEGISRSGDLLVMTGSHGNNRSGEVRTERRTFVAATITGSGADTEIVFRGRYNNLWAEMRTWDQTNGHGLGANALRFVAGTAPGVLPNAPDGFNFEGLEFAPDGETLYVGFRAPTIEVDGTLRALIVPILNVDEIIDGAPGTGPAEFGNPILLDLDGRSIRAIAKNDTDGYLISAGPSPQNPTWALYTWDGDPAHDAAFNRLLPEADLLTGGTWEAIGPVPEMLEEGATVRVIADSGDTNYYGTGATKDLGQGYQKSYSQEVGLADVPAYEDPPAVIVPDTESAPAVDGLAGGTALWVHPRNPNNSRVLAAFGTGGLASYDLEGNLRQLVAADGVAYGNVAVLYGAEVAGRTVDLAVATNRSSGAVRVFTIDATGGVLVDRTSPDSAAALFGEDGAAAGLAAFTSPVDDGHYVFVTEAGGDEVVQLRLSDDGAKGVLATEVRRLAVPGGIGAHEGIVVDADNGRVYVAAGTRIVAFDADPTAASAASVVTSTAGRLRGTVSALALYEAVDGAGYLLVANQGDASVAVFERGGTNAFAGRFVIGESVEVDAVEELAGLSVSNVAFGSRFPSGVVAAADRSGDAGELDNIKLIGWERVAAALDLLIDTNNGPRSG